MTDCHHRCDTKDADGKWICLICGDVLTDVTNMACVPHKLAVADTYDEAIRAMLSSIWKTQETHEQTMRRLLAAALPHLPPQRIPCDDEHHFCHFKDEDQVPITLKHCFTNKGGHLFMGNVFGVTVNFCPICGKKARTPVSA